MSQAHVWRFTTDAEFTADHPEDEFCVHVGAGDDCGCMACYRLETELDRERTERYWRDRIASEILTQLRDQGIPMTSELGTGMVRAADTARSGQ